MMQHLRNVSDDDADTQAKSANDHETDPTLPNAHSNTTDTGDTNGSVMWTGPESKDEGLRSKGLAESTQAIGAARGVTDGPVAEQTGRSGAARAYIEQVMHAQHESRMHSSTKFNVIETKGDEEAPWTKWRNDIDIKFGDLMQGDGKEVPDVPTLTREEAFEIVKTARKILGDETEARSVRQDTPASKSTLLDYAKKLRVLDAEVEGMDSGEPNPVMQVMIRHAPSKQTFSALKTALKWRCIEEIRRLLRAQDRMQRDQAYSPQWRAAVDRLQGAVKQTVQVQALNRIECLELTDAKPKASRSKKHLLPRLPAGWQDQFAKVNDTSPTYRVAGVLLRHCGMRPKELAGGVTLSMNSLGVQVEIVGAKVRATAGQPKRSFTLRSQSLPAWFVHHVHQTGSTMVRVKEDGLRAHLGRLSDAVFHSGAKHAPVGKRRLILSAYVFRHALVTELREAGWETELIAAVIGESSAETVRYYGTRSRTRPKQPKQVAIAKSSVTATRPVRAVDSIGLKKLLKSKTQRAAQPGGRP